MSTNARKPISKKARFEVFKRDSFRCQYCGESSPDVILHVDHIKPVATGGDNNPINLITSCDVCNFGKGATELSDGSALDKQRKQLEELNEKRLQLEMMIEWRNEVSNLDDVKIDNIFETIQDAMSKTVTDIGVSQIKRWVKKYDYQILLDSVDASLTQYLEQDDSGSCTDESIDKAWKYIPRIAAVKSKGDDPTLQEYFYIRGILRNRLNYCNESYALSLIKDAHECGTGLDDIKDIALNVRNWTQFRVTIEEIIEEAASAEE